MKKKLLPFAAFTAAFAALIAYVFWGTWSLDFAFVQPDSVLCYSPHWISDWVRGWLKSGRWNPFDICVFLGPPEFWQELRYAIPLYSTGLALAVFLRGRGLGNLASFGAGLLLTLCGYWSSLFSAGHAGWFYMITYMAWIPALADRAICTGRIRWWLLLGLVGGWSTCAQPDIWLMFVIFSAFFFVYTCIRERKLPWKGTLLAAVIFLLVGAPGIRGAVHDDLKGREEQIKKGDTVAKADKMSEDEKRWIFVTNWSLPSDEIAEFFVSRLNGDTSCPFVQSIGMTHGTGVKPYVGAIGRPLGAKQGNYRQHSVYVGWVTCLLALLASVFAIRDLVAKKGTVQTKDTLFFTAMAILFCLISLGRYCEPVYRVIYHLPFGDAIRCPVKWHHVTEFALVILAGFGIAALEKACAKFKAAKWVLLGLVLVGAVDLARIDRIYCAPVDLREAHRQKANMQMAFLSRNDFSNPQVLDMVRVKRIISLARPNPDCYLVGVLEPFGTNKDPFPSFGLPTALGILSLLTSLGVLSLVCLNKRLRT